MDSLEDVFQSEVADPLAAWMGPNDPAPESNPEMRILRYGRPPMYIGKCSTCGCIVETASPLRYDRGPYYHDLFFVRCPLGPKSVGSLAPSQSPTCGRIYVDTDWWAGVWLRWRAARG